MAASHHIFVVPTLTVLNSVCGTTFDSELAEDPRIKPYLLPSESAAMKTRFTLPGKLSCEGANQAIRQLKAAQVPILAGTDAATRVQPRAPAFTVSWNSWCAPVSLQPRPYTQPPPRLPPRSIWATAARSRPASGPTCCW